MKLFALLSAGALAAGTIVAAAPADAQHYGGYQRDHYRGGNYGHRGGYGYRAAYRHHGYGRGPGWRGGYRQRVDCRVHRGYYHAARRCY